MSLSLPLPYYNDDKKSFAYPTIHKRWPTIIEGAIRDVQKKVDADSSLQASGAAILGSLQKLLVDFKNDVTVEPFTAEEIALNDDLVHYNNSLESLNKTKKVTWQTGPWLYLECYLYQVINVYVLSSKDSFWHSFDVFEELKNSTFKQSELGVLELCKRYQSLHQQLESKGASLDNETLLILFKEFIDISLWGNATDLSLLAGNVTLEDIKSVQGAEVRKKNEENILVNDTEVAWKHLIGSKSKRIDIVLDNSGFELFADLIFTLFVLDSKIVEEVHLHCKEIPWFVSDTMPKDFDNLLKQLQDPEFYPAIQTDEHDKKSIDFLYSQLSKYVKSNKIVIDSHRFWTLDYNFWYIPEFKDLYETLSKSDLIIFKGDLNYRKLTGDLQWDKTTPFDTAIQQLSSAKLPILSLRTCKADVVVGLPKGVNETLIEKYKAQGNEIGEFWSSSGKWAVISFSDGQN
ncbi:Ty3 transposition effector [Scheffersomyces xylosifermentans]|uniref:Ty3 transposition effector n=1 Tax=Scheffersomyces xylosifermentans TaxID=1304137 RepID=UPI00315D5630